MTQPALPKKMAQIRRASGLTSQDHWPLPNRYALESKRMAMRVGRKLRASCPSLSAEVLSAFSVDVADVWEICNYQQHVLKELLRLRLPRDKRRLESLLTSWIEIQLLVHADWHLRSLKKLTPKVLRSIGRTAKKPRLK